MNNYVFLDKLKAITFYYSNGKLHYHFLVVVSRQFLCHVVIGELRQVTQAVEAGRAWLSCAGAGTGLQSCERIPLVAELPQLLEPLLLDERLGEV